MHKMSVVHTKGVMFSIFFVVLLMLIELCHHGVFAAVSFTDNGFELKTIASNLNPTQLAALPDGRILMLEKQGLIRVVKNDVMLPVSFNISDNVNDFDERGLLGITIDPSFNSNGYIYVYYTREGTTLKNRVSRFTMSGDSIDSASETLIFELDPLSSAGNHNGGGIAFGSDGKLYIAAGENTIGSNAQSNSSLLGKIHRINKDGSIPTDNPFYADLTGNYRAIYALGVRNPWTLHAASSGELIFFDVGYATWEEINRGSAGANYGWPTYEGYTSAATGIWNYKNPVYQFTRGSSNTQGCSIMGGLLYKNVSDVGRFPTKFHDCVFFADYCNAWINYFPVSSSPSANGSVGASVFLTGLNAPVTLIQSPDGSLWVTDRGSSAGGSAANTAVTTGTLYKIVYTGNYAPSIYQHPQAVLRSEGETATFSVGVTGFAPLSYQWRKNGANITGATQSTYTTPALSAADDGSQYSVLVWNSYPPAATSNSALLTVTPRTRPTVTFSSPANGSLYTAGDTISYAATATDSTDGQLSGSTFTWLFVFHHQQHTHPFIGPVTGQTSGTFVLPTSGEPDPVQWYRLHLDVTNSAGLTTSTFVDIVPRVATVTLVTSPPGQTVLLDSQSFQSPYSFAAVAGMTRSIGASTSNSSLAFSSWSDGGAATHDLTIPSANTTYTATFATPGSTTSSLPANTTPTTPSSSSTTTPSSSTTTPSESSSSSSTSPSSSQSFVVALLLLLVLVLLSLPH